MWSYRWFLCLSMAFACVYAFMFSSLREKAEELQAKVLCGRQCLIQQNQLEHAQAWLEIARPWLFLFVLMYVTVKLMGESGESDMQTPAASQDGSFGSPGQRTRNASPDKDCMLATITQLEMDLVKFVSRVRNLKLAMATCGNLKPPNAEVPADAPKNITLYQVWWDEDSD